MDIVSAFRKVSTKPDQIQVAAETLNDDHGSVGHYTAVGGWESHEVIFRIYCSCAGEIPAGYAQGSQEVQRPPIPTGEYSTPQGWSGYGPAVWAGILLPTTTNFYGRYVEEYPIIGSGSDGCRALDPDKIIDPFALTGGVWNVYASNFYGHDYIGFYDSAVTHYRNVGATAGPNGCTATVGQEMRINSGLGSLMVDYQVNTIGTRLTDTTVTSIRDGQEQTHVWP